jgi:hypothetical protein
MDPHLDVRAILQELRDGGVRFVLTGSVAAVAYGVPVNPGDLDVAPDLAADNLERLAAVVAAWDAKPGMIPIGPSR